MTARSRCWLLLPAALLLTGCQGTQSALDPAGPQAGRIFGLWSLFSITCTIVFLLVMGFALYAAFRAGRKHDMTPGEIPKQREAARWIAAATILTTLILFVFLVADAWGSHDMSSVPPPKDAIELDVIGHQWWWEFRYNAERPDLRVLTANEAHIPVGRTVLVRTSTRDVIHSFWVPNLAGKLDAIPDHVNTTWFKADRPGVFRGQCAEFCGYQHAHMGLEIIADPPDRFDAWYKHQLEPAAAPATAAQQKGHDVFLNAPCPICHTIGGTPALGQVAPDLTHVASREYIAAETLANTRGHLGGWITDSQRIKPGNHMPPIDISSADLQPLLEYLESLK